MDTIDLDAIQLKYINTTKDVVYPTREQVSDMMKEAIHQSLVLASEKAITEIIPTSDGYECWDVTGVDKQSILDVAKLIK